MYDRTQPRRSWHSTIPRWASLPIVLVLVATGSRIAWTVPLKKAPVLRVAVYWASHIIDLPDTSYAPQSIYTGWLAFNMWYPEATRSEIVVLNQMQYPWVCIKAEALSEDGITSWTTALYRCLVEDLGSSAQISHASLGSLLPKVQDHRNARSEQNKCRWYCKLYCWHGPYVAPMRKPVLWLRIDYEGGEYQELGWVYPRAPFTEEPTPPFPVARMLDMEEKCAIEDVYALVQSPNRGR